MVELPGYRDPRRVRNWMAHEQLLKAWRGERGGKDARAAYVRFVEARLGDPPPRPFREAVGGWILGSERFVSQLRKLAGTSAVKAPIPEARRLASQLLNDLIEIARRVTTEDIDHLQRSLNKPNAKDRRRYPKTKNNG
jgi:hypothetical protein